MPAEKKAMRILHIGKYFPPFAGGIENFTGDLLPALAEIGVETAALVHQHEPAGAAVNDPAAITRVPSYGRLLYAPISPGFPLALSRLLDSFRPDLLHIHMPNTSAFWALLSPKARRIPWIIHWHADVVASAIDTRLALAYSVYRPFEQALLRHAAKIICTTPDYLASSEPLKRWREKCTVVPLGIDPARLPVQDTAAVAQATRAFWGPTAPFKVVAIGRLTYYKGHDVLIRAIKELPHATLLLVGGGDRRARLERAIAREGLQQRVRLTGHLVDRHLQALIQSADCLCLPSLERTEAFGLVLLEAMRYGKAVIASSVEGSGMNWVVDHNTTGLLVPPGNVGELARALARLAASPTTRADMGRAGQQKFMDRLQINKIAEATQNVYKEIMVAATP
jgi:rhamnosyl/mannosyltransferase